MARHGQARPRRSSRTSSGSASSSRRAWWSRRRRWCAPGRSSTGATPRAAAPSGVSGRGAVRSAVPTWSQSRRLAARFHVRRLGPRLELLAEGLRGHGREPDPRRARGRRSRLRRDAASRLRRARARPPRTARLPGSCSCGSSSPARTSTASPAKASGRLGASAHGRMERLLRETGVPAGLLFNGRALRLLSAPRGESSGWLDFRVADMVQTAGRPISTALRLLLSQRGSSACRARSASPRCSRTAASSRTRSASAWHSRFSTRSTSCCAGSRPRTTPQRVSYCASRSPSIPTRSTARSSPSSCGSSSCSTPRSGTCCLRTRRSCATTRSPVSTNACARTPRSSRTRWTSATAPGRSSSSSSASDPRRRRARRRCACRSATASSSIPTASRSSRAGPSGRAPDRRAHRAAARARRHHLPRAREAPCARRRAHLLPRARRGADRLGLRDDDGLPARDRDRPLGGDQGAAKKHGAPTAVDLEALLAEPAAKREKWLQDRTDRKLTDKVTQGARRRPRRSRTWSALLPVIASTPRRPDLVPKGAMVLQPSEERRRSGSHYTPRALTEPIVRTTLRADPSSLRGARPPPRPSRSSTSRSATRRWARGRSWSRPAASSATRWSRPGARTTSPRSPPTRTRSSRAAPGRAALPLRRRQEPRGGGPGQAVALARYAGQGPAAHLRRPRAAARRLAGRPVARADRGIPLGLDDASRQRSARVSACRNDSSACRRPAPRIREADENVTDWELRDLLGRCADRAGAGTPLGRPRVRRGVLRGRRQAKAREAKRVRRTRARVS